MTTINNTTTTTQPWVEKYRPKNLQSVSHQKEVVATLQNAVSSGNLPHLLFYGPPGSGKVSVLLVQLPLESFGVDDISILVPVGTLHTHVLTVCCSNFLYIDIRRTGIMSSIMASIAISSSSAGTQCQ